MGPPLVNGGNDKDVLVCYVGKARFNGAAVSERRK